MVWKITFTTLGSRSPLNVTIFIRHMCKWVMGATPMLTEKDPVYISDTVTHTLTNSEDPDGMPHIAAFHQGLQCLQR